MKKRLTAVILAAVLALAASFSAFAGVWDYTGGYWYYSDPEVSDDDEYLTGWQWIDGYCYYFDPDESGMMWVSAVTPDGFSVNEVGRMTDVYGEPYYIPGWGLSATNAGPADYDYNDAYYSDYPYPLYSVWDIDYLEDLWRGRDRDRDEYGRRNPDTVIIQVEINGVQPQDPAGLPENPEGLLEDPAGLPEDPVILPEIPQDVVNGAGDVPHDPVINAGADIKLPEIPAEQPVKPEEPAKDSGEQPENPVIKAGDTGSQSESAQNNSGNGQTNRPATRPQGAGATQSAGSRAQGSSTQSTAGRAQAGSAQSAAGAGRPAPANGNAAGAGTGLNDPDMDLLLLLGLAQE